MPKNHAGSLSQCVLWPNLSTCLFPTGFFFEPVFFVLFGKGWKGMGKDGWRVKSDGNILERIIKGTIIIEGLYKIVMPKSKKKKKN